jgi:thioredoxin reductase (NADPH)
MEEDVVIIGGGAAGLSAALWCVELGLKPLLLEQNAEPGGQLMWIHNPIKNHLGGVTANGGKTMRDIILAQVAGKFDIRKDVAVTAVDLNSKQIGLGDGKSLAARAIVIATGVRRRTLDVPGENEFAGKGIMVSGSRDRETITGKDVCIIGGGDAAFENALILAEFAKSVTLVHRGGEFRARAEFTNKVKDDRKITTLSDTVITRIDGKESVESVELLNNKTNEAFTVPAQAVLVRIGILPNTELFRDQIKLDRKGFIEVSNRCETAIEGVYAAGDVAAPFSKSISTAVGMGATAARAIFARLMSARGE